MFVRTVMSGMPTKMKECVSQEEGKGNWADCVVKAIED